MQPVPVSRTCIECKRSLSEDEVQSESDRNGHTFLCSSCTRKGVRCTRCHKRLSAYDPGEEPDPAMSTKLCENCMVHVSSFVRAALRIVRVCGAVEGRTRAVEP